MHNFIKLSPLRAYIVIQKFHDVCLLEKYYNSSISYDDDVLKVLDYDLILADHRSITQRLGACITEILFSYKF